MPIINNAVVYTLASLKNENLNTGKHNIRYKKPYGMQVKESNILLVDSWTELCIKFVEWLDENDYLTEIKRILNSEKDTAVKCFINTKPDHLISGKDGEWKKVGRHWVDVKYNANAHKNRIIHVCKTLNIKLTDVSIFFLPR